MRVQKGISYLEIMIVVFIIGIVTTVAMPSLSSSDSKKLDMAARLIANTIAFTRAEAVRKKKHMVSTLMP